MSGKKQKPLSHYLGDRIVLVVEPSTNYRTSIKQFLTNLRVGKMKLVSSVGDARREMLTSRVGLFIAEWALDGMNGLQFCRTLRKEAAYKDTPFVLLSTENLRKDVILASEVRIDAYLIKPFSYEDFSAQIQGIMAATEAPGRIRQMLDSADEALKAGELDKAQKLYDEARAQSGDKSARAICGLGAVLAARERFPEALTLLKQALTINPDYIEALRLMLDIHERSGNRAGIMQVAGVLHSHSPENPRYTLILAHSYLDLGGLEASEGFFRKTIALSPRLAEAHKGLGNVFLAQEEYEKAMKSFRRALDLDETDISTLNSIGMTHVRMGQYKEGIDKYMLALRLKPHDERVLFNLGHAHEKHGDLKKAGWYYAQALIHKAGFEKAARGLERVEKAGAAAADAPDDDSPEIVTEMFKKSG